MGLYIAIGSDFVNVVAGRELILFAFAVGWEQRLLKNLRTLASLTNLRLKKNVGVQLLGAHEQRLLILQ